jgi:hypothetical protein
LQFSATSIRNNSSKTVAEVRLVWFLSRSSEPRRLLATGVTPTVFPLRVDPATTLQTRIPIVAFADIYKPFVLDGRLAGDFVIEVAVTEARLGA